MPDEECGDGSARAATWRFAIAEELHQPGTGRTRAALIRVADDGWFANRHFPHLRAHRSLHSLGFTRALPWNPDQWSGEAARSSPVSQRLSVTASGDDA